MCEFDLSIIDRLLLEVSAKYPQERGWEWSEQEKKYLLENHTKKTDVQMAAELKRTVNAVKIFRLRSGLLSANRARVVMMPINHAAELIGMDMHKLSYLCDRGIIKSFKNGDNFRIRSILKQELIKFCVNPENWVLHDWHKIPDPHIRRLCELRAERWGDEWWTGRQAADYHGVNCSDVSRMVKQKKLRGIQVEFPLSGRKAERTPAWRLWFYRKSDVIAIKIPRAGDDMSKLTPRADAWIMKAKSMGMSASEINRTMGIGMTAAGINNRIRNIERRKNAGLTGCVPQKEKMETDEPGSKTTGYGLDRPADQKQTDADRCLAYPMEAG